MSFRRRVILAVLWALSLAVAGLKTEAQVTQIGTEVIFLQGQAKGGKHSGILVANFGGQWLPVTLDTMPDANRNDLLR